MILHKIENGLDWTANTVPPVMWEFLGLLILWCGTAALWFFPLARIVIDAGPKGDSNGLANVMEVFGTILGLVTIGLTLSWFYCLEERHEKRKVQKAENAVLARVDSFREMRDKEEILGLDPYPLDDEMSRYLYEEHPVESSRKGWTSYVMMNGYHRNYDECGQPLPPQRIRSNAYATLIKELTPHGD